MLQFITKLVAAHNELRSYYSQVIDDKENAILVYGRGWRNVVSGIDGELLWRIDFSIGSEQTEDSVERIVLSPDRESIYAIGFIEKSSVVVFEDFSSEAELLPLKFEGAFALKVASHILLIKIGNTCREIYLLEKVSEPVIISDGLLLSSEQQAFAVVQHLDKNMVSLTVMLNDGQKNEILREIIELDPQKGILQKVFINNYLRVDMSHEFRALITAEDHSLALLQQGEIVWSKFKTQHSFQC